MQIPQGADGGQVDQAHRRHDALVTYHQQIGTASDVRRATGVGRDRIIDVLGSADLFDLDRRRSAREPRTPPMHHPLKPEGIEPANRGAPPPPWSTPHRRSTYRRAQVGQELVRRDRQLPHPNARGVSDGVGDRGRRRDQTDLPQALGPVRSGRIVSGQENGADRGQVCGTGCGVLEEAGIDEPAAVVDELLTERGPSPITTAPLT